ncbi:MAG: D-alanyl-D-alanine carboxypeptidase [Clostridia bacterium]|nr:D-alanyl-D-alanine carboxypeptidase [Clostridia bacterium]
MDNNLNNSPRRSAGSGQQRPGYNNMQHPSGYGSARQQTATKPRPQQPGNVAQRKQASKKTAHSIKNTSTLVKVFTTLVAVAFVIIIVQTFTKPQDFDIMNLFETTPSEYDTSASANVQGGNSSLMTYPARTENTKHLDIDSSHGILINLRNNTVIAEKNGREKMYPASMTKILTLIVAYENAPDLDDTFTFDFDIVNDAYLAGASVAGFTTGETVTIRDLLYGTVLPSGADATTALAQYIAGDEVAFAALMNKKAKEIGMTNSHFVTASGLHDDDHYSTCEDMALALKYAIATPELREILGTYTYTTSKTPEHPDGIMLFSTMYTKMKGDEAGDTYVQGGKTGYTPEAHNCLASFAAKCEEEDAELTAPQYILVTGGGIGEYAAIYDAINAYKKYT